MNYYKKISDNKIYSFLNPFSEEQYNDFLNGLLEGDYVGDFYDNPFECVRRLDNTSWSFFEPLTLEEMSVFHTGTTVFTREEEMLVGVFTGFPVVYMPVLVPDWANLRELLYNTQAFMKAFAFNSVKLQFVQSLIVQGESSNSISEGTLLIGINAVRDELVGSVYAFNQQDIDDINSALLNSQFSIQVNLEDIT
jgi:hypothetical protein